ncbi:F-box domain-containing protein [Xylaria sp. FL1777]|nr:F-box domain-containing protein [Xylaria sp. FL1777]
MSTELSSYVSHRPRDLLYSIITISDPPSPLTQISKITSHPWSFPTYRDLMNRASHALAALGQTKLYGAYLFPQTCERCCWQYLRSNLIQRVVSPTAASRVFALSPKMVQQLPVLFSISGTYGVSRKSTQRSVKLCSMPAAKKLAMSVDGSAENLIQVVMRKDPKRSTTRYLQAEDIGVDRYFGMVSIPFPSLTAPDIIENGLWCKGCEWTYNRREHVPIDCDPNRVLFGMTRRARSKIRLLAHVFWCYYLQLLLL